MIIVHLDWYWRHPDLDNLSWAKSNFNSFDGPGVGAVKPMIKTAELRGSTKNNFEKKAPQTAINFYFSLRLTTRRKVIFGN